MGIQPIGVAGDGGKMRKLLKAEKPQALIADCWTHQVPLMLGNYYKRNPKVATLVDQAIKFLKYVGSSWKKIETAERVMDHLRRIYIDIRIKDRTRPNAAGEDDSRPVTAIIDSIEKQWRKADQDLFIAYSPPGLMQEVFQYYNNEGIYSKELWPDGSTDNPIELWKLLSASNPLFKLLLSFVPSLATVMRLFLKMGNINTKKHTWLGTKKLHDIVAYIKTKLWHEQAQEGIVANTQDGTGGDGSTSSASIDLTM
ncbi:hypothetical protein L208DRAFT_1379644 [Tricholoma matsutake]|nr:hypothetical protein L208DRAFT_1379644 [Tricholoma matsutake 945]